MSTFSLYHDESKLSGYWHGMLLVPNETKDQLVSVLDEVRKNLNHHSEIGLKKVNREGNKVYELARSWIHIGCGSLRSRTKNVPYPVFMGKNQKGRRVIEESKLPIGCKLIILRDLSEHSELGHFSDHPSKIETFIRVGLKGGLHLIGSESHPIHINRLHFDGHQHYGRNISHERIINRMEGLRNYCSVSGAIDDRQSNHEKDHSQSYEDCQLLQLTDLLVGSFRSCVTRTRECHEELIKIPKDLIESFNKGSARMRNSRWKDSLSFSECKLSSTGWTFSPIRTNKEDPNQLKLT